MRPTLRAPKPVIPTSAVLLLFLSVPLIVFASAVNPEPVLLQQPDGTRFWARNWGDEWLSGTETLDGYAILRDPKTGAWVYAQKDREGSLVPSSLVVGRHLPVGLRKHLRPQLSPALLAAMEMTAKAALGIQAAPPTLGTHRLLAIVVDFSPSASLGSTELDWEQHFFTGGGPYTPRSVRQFWTAASYGNLTIDPAAESYGVANNGIVFVTLPYAHPNCNAGGTSTSTGDCNRKIVRDAIRAADPFVNFAAFDTNPTDGYLNTNELHLYTVVRGYEASFAGSATCSDRGMVWAHRWLLGTTFTEFVEAPTVDGVVVGHYQGAPFPGAFQGGYMQEGEWHCATPSHTPGHKGTIGQSAHELGHDLGTGVPDLYDRDSTSRGIGDWGLQGSGSWNAAPIPGHAGTHPALPDPWSRWFFGFITPTEITTTTMVSLPQIETATGSNRGVFQLLPNPGGVDWSRGSPGTGEYFLIENRQQVGDFDAALPGSGLLIWHIYEPAPHNDNEGTAPPGNPRIVVLEQADGRFDLECYTQCNAGDSNDPWKLGTATAFTDTSTPNSRRYDGTTTGVSVTSISASGPTMSADLAPSPAGGPPNDNFANAAVLTTTPYTNTVVTTAATTEPGDPTPTLCNTTNRYKTVWYRFTPLSNGTVTADTFGSNYDTILSVWTGSPGSFAPVACNDDVSTSNLQSRVSFTATAGTAYFFMVSAFDNDGGTSVFNLSFQGTGDTTPPDTIITSGPSGTITTNSATFSWTGSDNVTPTANLVYAFRLDPLEPNFSAFTLATSKSYSNLANGAYTFYVKASDQAGNQDPTPATRTFTVQAPVTDTTPPDTVVTSGPTGTMTTNTATFSWTGSDNVTPTANLTYATQLHPLEAGFSPFSSATSKTYSAIPNGTYTFFVVARDQAGNTDPTPASRTFTVNVTGTPMIEFDPTTLAFNAVEGGSNPASKTLNIFNAGTGTLNWSVSASKPWLILTPTSGTSTAQFNPVTVSANIAGLTDGGHGADIVISAPGAANSPRRVRVSVAIDPRPRSTYFVPHIVSGDGFVTKMTVMNLSENANDVAVNFFSQAGRLLNTERFVLPPGGTQRISTREQDRFASPTIRWATLDAPFSLGINLFFELQHAGSDRMVTSVGFNDVPPLQEFALPIELEPARPGDPAPRTVGLALANVSGSSNSVLLKLIDPEGKLLAQETKTLAPFAQEAFNIEDLPSFKAALPRGNFVGVVTVSATRLLSAIGVGDDFGPFFSIPVITGRAGTLLIPHIVTGGGFVTKMTLVNLAAGPNDILVKFFSQSGTLLETTPLSLPPYGTRRISTPEGERFAAVSTRWATIEAPSPVGVNLFFELKQPGSDRIDTTVGFNDASSMRDFTLPLELEPARPGDPAPRTVGLALANPSSSASTVTLKLLDHNGNVLAVQTLLLGPFAQTAFTIDTLPAFRTELPTGNFIGVLTVSATSPLSAIGVGDDFGPFFSIPIIPGRAR